MFMAWLLVKSFFIVICNEIHNSLQPFSIKLISSVHMSAIELLGAYRTFHNIYESMQTISAEALFALLGIISL